MMISSWLLSAARQSHAASHGHACQAVRTRWLLPATNLSVLRQIRRQSTHDGPKSSQNSQKLPPRGQNSAQPTLRQVLAYNLRLLRTFRPRDFAAAVRKDPMVGFAAAFALLSVIGGTAILFYYYVYIDGPLYSKYPPEVANSLRRALYYTNIRPDPKMASKYYRKAVQQCEEMNLDPFLDEVMGIKIQASLFLEKTGYFRNAVLILEQLLEECQRWVELMEKGMEDGTFDKSGVPPKRPQKASTDENGQSKTTEDPEFIPENLWHKRTRILAKAVSISLKLGDLYATEEMLDSTKALSRLTWGVETAMKEARRRVTEGVKDVEGEWLKPEEMGAAMEALGQEYEKNLKFELALPLFFQALRLCREPCHSSVIMNNLAVCFAQYPSDRQIDLVGSLFTSNPDMNVPKTRKELLEAATNWARNAYEHASTTKGPERTEECDQACAVALCNLGDIFVMSGDKEQARRRFREAIAVSQKLDFAAGVEQAQTGLRKLGNIPSRG